MSVVFRAPIRLTKFLMLLPMRLLTLPRTVQTNLTASTRIKFFLGIKFFLFHARRTFGSVLGTIVILVEWFDPFGCYPAGDD